MIAHGTPQNYSDPDATPSGTGGHLGDVLFQDALEVYRKRSRCRESSAPRGCHKQAPQPLESLRGFECIRDANGLTLFMESVHRGARGSAAEVLSAVGPGVLLCADHEGRNPLHMAAASRRDDGTVGWLLQDMIAAEATATAPSTPEGSGALAVREAMDQRDLSGRIPLACAQTAQSVTALLDAGSPPEGVNHVDHQGEALLQRAVAAGHIEMVDALLSLRADPSPPIHEMPGVPASSPLLTACRMTSGAHFIRALAAARADLSVPHGESRTTALHAGAQRGHADVVRALLELRANPLLQAEGKVLPRDLARNPEVLKVLDAAAWKEEERVA